MTRSRWLRSAAISFDFGDGRVPRNKIIDTRLSTVLFALMGQAVCEPASLATRNLLRSLALQVLSGQRVAKAMEVPALADADLVDLAPFELQNRTPLWFCARRTWWPTGGTSGPWVAALWQRSSSG